MCDSNDMSSKRFSILEWAALLTLMSMALWLRISYAPTYPYHEDESITLAVADAIVKTGLPLMGGDFIYWRSLLGNYLLAIPHFFLETSPLTLRLTPIVISVLLLPIAFFMGKGLHNRLAGFAAALFLAFSSYQNLYSEMARFYIPFQFFFTASVFLMGQYLIRGIPKRGMLLWLVAAGAISTHKLSLMLAPIFLLALISGRRWPLLKTKAFWLATLSLTALAYVLLFFKPSHTYLGSLAIPLKIGAWPDKAVFAKAFFKFVPFSLSLTILAIPHALKKTNRLFRFYFLAFILSMLTLSLLTPEGNPRYMSHLFPLGVIVVAGSITYSFETVVQWFKKGPPSLSLLQTAGLLLILTLAAVTTLTTQKNHLTKSIGPSITFYDQGPPHRFISERLLPNDLVISLEPGLTHLYLTRPADYFLREKLDRTKRSYSPFTIADKASFPIPVMDSPAEMRRLLSNSRQRIWLYANRKINFTVSEEMRILIQENFAPLFSYGQTSVLLSRPR